MDKISNICFKIAGHACKLIEIDDPLPPESRFTWTLLFNLDCDVDFLCIGRLIVKTFVLEPKAPSIDIVNHEGWQTTVLLFDGWVATVCTLVAPGDLVADEPCVCFDVLQKYKTNLILNWNFFFLNN